MRLDKLNKMDEFHLCAYERSNLYNERIKLYHGRKIERRELYVGDLVLLFNLRFKLFLGKLKSKLSRPVKVTQVFPPGVVEVENKEGKLYKVNRK